MKLINLNEKMKPVAVITLFMAICYFLFTFVFTNEILRSSIDESFISAVTLTIGLSFFQTFFIVVVSVIISIKLHFIKYSKIKVFLPILLLPFLLGDTSATLLWKLTFQEYSFLYSSGVYKLIGVLIINFWHYGMLLIYLFTLGFAFLSKNDDDYINSNKIPVQLYIKDFGMPNIRLLLTILSILLTLIFFYEYAHIQTIFKGSRGTNSELIGLWLERNYQNLTQINASVAREVMILISFNVLLPVAIIMCYLTSIIYPLLCNNNIFIKFISFGHKSDSNTISYIVLILTVVFLFYPFYTLLSMKVSSSAVLEGTHIKPILWTLLTSFISVLIALAVSIFIRTYYRKAMASINGKSIIAFFAFFFVKIIPPISIFILTISLFSYSWVNRNTGMYISWCVGQIFFTVPVLIVFLSTTFMKVFTSSIEYHIGNNISNWQYLNNVYIIPFKKEILITGVIGFSIIWNETTLNSMFSSVIPSYVSQIRLTISGRGVDYSSALYYFYISFSISLFIIFFLAYRSWIYYRKGEEN